MMLTVSLVQIDVCANAPQVNWAAVQTHCHEAARRGAALVVLPELWDAGVGYGQGQTTASVLGEGLFAEIAKVARTCRVAVVGSIYERADQGIFNTMAVIGSDGEVWGVYRKIHLFPLMDEPRYMQAGQAPLILDMPWGRTGFAICYDLRFPELFREYARHGADVIVMAMAWPHPRRDHYQTLLRARAIENQCYMIAVNRVGNDPDGTRYFGHSCVIDPWGQSVVEAGEIPAHLTVPLDLALVTEVRRKLPVLQGIDRSLKSEAPS